MELLVFYSVDRVRVEKRNLLGSSARTNKKKISEIWEEETMQNEWKYLLC